MAKKSQITPEFSVDIEAHLEDYEHQYFDVLKVNKVSGLFGAARSNVLAAIKAGWFGDAWGESDLAAMPAGERVKLSKRIDERYRDFLPTTD